MASIYQQHHQTSNVTFSYSFLVLWTFIADLKRLRLVWRRRKTTLIRWTLFPFLSLALNEFKLNYYTWKKPFPPSSGWDIFLRLKFNTPRNLLQQTDRKCLPFFISEKVFASCELFVKKLFPISQIFLFSANLSRFSCFSWVKTSSSSPLLWEKSSSYVY